MKTCPEPGESPSGQDSLPVIQVPGTTFKPQPTRLASTAHFTNLETEAKFGGGGSPLSFGLVVL